MISALGAGFLFGIGLWLSGMANPRKVLDFLDVAGNWDPSLLLVMGGVMRAADPGQEMRALLAIVAGARR